MCPANWPVQFAPHIDQPNFLLKSTSLICRTNHPVQFAPPPPPKLTSLICPSNWPVWFPPQINQSNLPLKLTSQFPPQIDQSDLPPKSTSPICPSNWPVWPLNWTVCQIDQSNLPLKLTSPIYHPHTLKLTSPLTLKLTESIYPQIDQSNLLPPPPNQRQNRKLSCSKDHKVLTHEVPPMKYLCLL